MRTCVLFLWVLLSVCVLPLQAQTVEYVHTDALGTPVAITNAAGQVIERSEYEPYGKLVNRPLTDGPGFTGHVQDATTGLTYMQQRYYDPIIGRFLSVDPVAVRQGGDNFNRYAYAFNNPYKFTDPDGRDGGNFYTDPNLRMAQPTITREMAGTMADFTPGVGDVKGFVDAYNDPTPVNIFSAVIGLAGPIGDGVGKLLKNAERISDLRPVHSVEALGDRPDISNLSDGELMNSVTNPANGDFVTVNTRTGGVVDGNTRVTELQKRAADPNSKIDGSIPIPVKHYTPDNSDLPDLK